MSDNIRKGEQIMRQEPFHYVLDNKSGTDKLRKELLRLHVQIVRKLIPPNSRAIHGE